MKELKHEDLSCVRNLHMEAKDPNGLIVLMHASQLYLTEN